MKFSNILFGNNQYVSLSSDDNSKDDDNNMSTYLYQNVYDAAQRLWLSCYEAVKQWKFS